MQVARPCSRQDGCSQFTIHGTAKRSTTIPNPAAQNVFAKGISTRPPCETVEYPLRRGGCQLPLSEHLGLNADWRTFFVNGDDDVERVNRLTTGFSVSLR